MRQWTETEVRTAMRSIALTAEDRVAVQAVGAYARSRSFVSERRDRVGPLTRGLGVVAGIAALVGFAVLNVNLLGARGYLGALVPTGTATPTAIPLPSGPRTPGPLQDEVVYGGGTLRLSPPAITSVPPLSYEDAVTACSESPECVWPSTKPIVPRLALAVSNMGLGSGADRVNPGESVLVWAQIWTDACVAYGPAVSSGGSGGRPPASCEYVLLINARTGRYLNVISSNQVWVAAPGARAEPTAATT